MNLEILLNNFSIVCCFFCIIFQVREKTEHKSYAPVFIMIAAVLTISKFGLFLIHIVSGTDFSKDLFYTLLGSSILILAFKIYTKR